MNKAYEFLAGSGTNAVLTDPRWGNGFAELEGFAKLGDTIEWVFVPVAPAL